MADPSSLLPSDSKLSTLGLAVGNTSYLRIYSWGSLSGLKLSLNWRLEHQGYKSDIQSQQYTADTGRTAGGSPKSFSLGAVGVLTAVSVTVVSGTPLRGQCFVKVELRDDAGEASGAAATAIRLIAGYIVTGRDLVAPFNEDPNSGPGTVYNAGSLLASTGAGVLAVSVPTNARWAVRSWGQYLSMSTVAQSPAPQFYVTDGSQTVWRAPLSPSAGPASSKTLFLVTPGYPVATDTSVDANGTMRIHGKTNWANPQDGGFAAGWVLFASVALATGVAFNPSTPLWVEEWIVPS